MIILGIETSCDETALALIETRTFTETIAKEVAMDTEYRVIQSLVHSQAELHSAYGGVFPTLAKREHSKNILPLLKKILRDIPVLAKISDEKFEKQIEEFQKEFGEQNRDLMEEFGKKIGARSTRSEEMAQDKNSEPFLRTPDSELMTPNFLRNIPSIDMIAVTEGPGLEPALWVGITFAKILGSLWNIPIVPIDHMEGHIVGSLLESDKPMGSWQKLKNLELPSVALLISGGHTELVQINQEARSTENGEMISNEKLEPFLRTSSSGLRYVILGQTRDDAVGECFDKTARLLGLPYPGGPHISMLANQAREANIKSLIKLPRPMLHSNDLDFSFSGLKTAVLYAVRDAEKNNPSGKINDDFKKGFAREFEDAVADVLDSKLENAIEQMGAKSIIIGGGVAANTTLRERFGLISKKYDIPIFLPLRHISGDNALMIALAGAINYGNTFQNKKSPVSNRGLSAKGNKRLT